MTAVLSPRALLDRLVSFPTVSRDSNLALVDWVEDYLSGHGIASHRDYDPTGQTASLYAHAGPEVAGGVILSGHTDVVPVDGQAWDTDPFSVVEKDGKLFGRGTCDMKGFIAAAVAMAPVWAERATRRPVYFAFTHDEEVGCLGAQALVKLLEGRQNLPSVAIVGEPTSMRIIEGHKGCFEYSTHFTGLEGHGSAPDMGDRKSVV